MATTTADLAAALADCHDPAPCRCRDFPIGHARHAPDLPPGIVPVPESQLASMEKLPFLRRRFGYAVAQVGVAAALSQKYLAGWGTATQKSVVCRPQQGGYRCAWSYQLNGAHHSGYVLVAVTANNYRLGKVAEVTQAAPASPASSLSPLWYISIAAVVVIVAIVAVLRRRRRATATAQ